MKRFIFLAILAAAALCTISCGMFAPENPEEAAAMKKKASSAVKSMDMTIEINEIIPVSMPAKTATIPYLLVFKDDTINGKLPYIGTLNNGNALSVNIEFDASKFTVTNRRHDRKSGDQELSIKAKSRDWEEFDITLSISENGYVNMSFSSARRSRISYYGALR